MGFKYPFQTGTNTLSIVSFMFFAVGCLITAFTLGFGIRLQSLEASRLQLERECDITQTRLIRISRPLQIYLTRRENFHFNRKFIQIRNEIMNLMLERTTLTRRAAATPLVKSSEKNHFLSNLNKWLRKRLAWRTVQNPENKDPGPEQSSQHETGGLSASEDVKLCFPKLEADLTSLQSEAGEVRSRIDSVKRKYGFAQSRKASFTRKELRI